MSLLSVKEYLKDYNKENNIIELSESTATVELAAKALNVEPGRIAKTLSFKVDKTCLLIIIAGDKRIDNRKYKETFHIKAKMLTPEEVIEYTGHEIGGVCPFAISNPNVKIYCDISIKKYQTVFPACGSKNSAIEITPEDLFSISKSIEWVDISK